MTTTEHTADIVTIGLTVIILLVLATEIYFNRRRAARLAAQREVTSTPDYDVYVDPSAPDPRANWRDTGHWEILPTDKKGVTFRTWRENSDGGE